MKRVYVLFAVLFMSVQVFAANPVNKGNFVITMPVLDCVIADGDLYEYNGNKQKGIQLSGGSYNIGIEWFIIDGLAIGGAFNYEFSKAGNYEEKTKSISPEINYYLNIDKIILYGGVMFNYSINKFSGNSDSTKNTFTGINLKLGTAYMLGQNIAAFGEFSYGIRTMEVNSYVGSHKYDGNRLSFSAGFKAFF